jgi:hypothetical protein
LGGFPGISEIAAGAKRGRQNQAGDPSRTNITPEIS